jgi:hypothetical protein
VDAPAGADEDALLELALQGRSAGQTASSTSHLDAIARLGGPLVSFLEFTTPEEAAQQLGRVIIGAPTAADPSFDLEVTWTWSGAEGTERKTVSMRSVTDAQIVDAPFAFDGTVRPGRWTAEVELAWRGETLSFAHQSKPVFPTICAWQVLVYDEQQEKPALEQVLAGEGATGERLPWKEYVQTADGLINVNEPHVVWLSREYGQALAGGARLAAYARASVNSPDEREAVIRFAATDSTALYLNGREVEDAPPGEGAELQGLLRGTRRTAVIHLRQGRNTLVVHSKAARTGTWWVLGGRFEMPDGEVMTDLSFDLA